MARVIAPLLLLLVVGCAETRPAPGPELIEFTIREKAKAFCPDAIYDYAVAKQLKRELAKDDFSRWTWDEENLKVPLIYTNLNRNVPENDAEWETIADLHRTGVISWDHRDCPKRVFAAAIVQDHAEWGRQWHEAVGIGFE